MKKGYVEKILGLCVVIASLAAIICISYAYWAAPKTVDFATIEKLEPGDRVVLRTKEIYEIVKKEGGRIYLQWAFEWKGQRVFCYTTALSLAPNTIKVVKVSDPLYQKMNERKKVSWD